jgi:hypothetical protein
MEMEKFKEKLNNFVRIVIGSMFVLMLLCFLIMGSTIVILGNWLNIYPFNIQYLCADCFFYTTFKIFKIIYIPLLILVLIFLIVNIIKDIRIIKEVIEFFETPIYFLLYILALHFGLFLFSLFIVEGIEILYVFLDKSEFVKIETTVINKYTMPGSKSGTNHYLEFNFKCKYHKSHISLTTSEYTYNKVKIGDKATLYIKKGFFNIGWVHKIQLN